MSYYLTCILFMKGSHLCEEELKTKSGTVTSLLFMYLSDWYSPLLSWYGNELVLLECCLQNNTGCLTVVFLCCQNKNWIAATFVTENEKKRKHCGSSRDYQKLESRITSLLWYDRLYRRDKCHGRGLPRYEKYSFLSTWFVFVWIKELLRNIDVSQKRDTLF